MFTDKIAATSKRPALMVYTVHAGLLHFFVGFLRWLTDYEYTALIYVPVEDGGSNMVG